MSQDFYDLRYPRPFWFRVGRRLLIILGSFAEGLLNEPIRSIFFLFIAYLVWAVISLIVHGITWHTLFTLQALSALPLSSGAWWQSNWWKILLILVTMGVALLTLAVNKYSAANDLECERIELKERRHPPGFKLRSISPPGVEQIYQMAWSPDGDVLALRTDKVTLWQPETGTVLRTMDTGYRVVSMAWSPDGLRLATINHYGVLALWDSQTGAKQQSYNFEDSAANSSDHRIAWSPDEFVDRGVPVIPVLLPDAPTEPKLPLFLKAMTWVDFRVQEPEPMQRLLWGITGDHPTS